MDPSARDTSIEPSFALEAFREDSLDLDRDGVANDWTRRIKVAIRRKFNCRRKSIMMALLFEISM